MSERSLRYYETQQLISPSRDTSGYRVYTTADVDTVVQIQELYAAGFCSTGIRELLPALCGQGGPTATSLESMLAAARAVIHTADGRAVVVR